MKKKRKKGSNVRSRTFFGIRRKSTKSHTYQSDAYGQQVTKDRVWDVKNPRSSTQMEQRMFMATASAGYAKMRSIVDHSIEGKTYGAQTMAMFTKINLDAIRKSVTDGALKFFLNPYKDRSLYPGAYQVAKGSLEPVVYTTGASPSALAYCRLTTNVVSAGQRLQAEIHANGASNPFNANHFAQNFGVGVGDMITLVMIAQLTSGGYRFAWARIKLIKLGSVSLSSTNVTEYFVFEDNVGATMTYDAEEGAILVTWPAFFKAEKYSAGDDAWTIAAFGAIKSAKESGVWKRSDCILDVAGFAGSIPAENDILQTYPMGETYILNGGGDL